MNEIKKASDAIKKLHYHLSKSHVILIKWIVVLHVPQQLKKASQNHTRLHVSGEGAK